MQNAVESEIERINFNRTYLIQFKENGKSKEEIWKIANIIEHTSINFNKSGKSNKEIMNAVEIIERGKSKMLRNRKARARYREEPTARCRGDREESERTVMRKFPKDAEKGFYANGSGKGFLILFSSGKGFYAKAGCCS